MQISNLHPDTETHVWTINGYMPRASLIPSSRRVETPKHVAVYTEYRELSTNRIVRRDCDMKLRSGLRIGGAASS